MRVLLLFIGLLALGGLASPAAAQDDVECHEVRPGQIQCGTQTIYGRRHGPQGALLIPRALRGAAAGAPRSAARGAPVGAPHAVLISPCYTRA